MTASKYLEIFLGGLLLIIFIYVQTTSAAIDCYQCQDCESDFNSSHVKPCKGSSDRCIKKVLLNGEIDRECGDKRKCAGRDKRIRRSISHIDSLSLNDSPRRRFVRSLLGDDKPSKKEGDGTKEISSVHCCSESECNGSSLPAKWISSPLTPLLTLGTTMTLNHFYKMFN